MQSSKKGNDARINRRAFVVNCGKAIAAAAVMPSMIVSLSSASSVASGDAVAAKTITLDITKQENSALATVGGAIYVPDFNIADKPIIVARISNSTVAAYSSKCAHLGCQVPLPYDNLITCDCHGSQYDGAGNLLKGPAATGLKKYAATLQGTTITIKETIQDGIATALSPEPDNRLKINCINNVISVALPYSISRKMKVRLFGSNGKTMLSTTVIAEMGTLRFPVKSLPAGVYIITITNNKDINIASPFKVH